MTTKFALVQIFFERGGARYCGSSVMAVRDTVDELKKLAEDHIQMSRDTMDWADEPVKWTWHDDEKQWSTVDFEAFSDFCEFRIDEVTDAK